MPSATPGGGYGDPYQCDPQQVARDVARGYYTPAQVVERIGVRLDPQGEVGEAAATRLRAQRPREAEGRLA